MTQKKDNLCIVAGVLFLAVILFSVLQMLVQCLVNHLPLGFLWHNMKASAIQYVLYILIAVFLFLRMRNVTLPIVFGVKALYGVYVCFTVVRNWLHTRESYYILTAIGRLLVILADVLMCVMLIVLLTKAMDEAKSSFRKLWVLPGVLMLLSVLLFGWSVFRSCSFILRQLPQYFSHGMYGISMLLRQIGPLLLDFLALLLPCVGYFLTGLWASRPAETAAAAAPAQMQPDVNALLTRYQQQRMAGQLTAQEYEAKRRELMRGGNT